MSNASLEKLLKELAEILQESTEKYREEIDVISPTIVSLSDSSLKVSLSDIITKINKVPGLKSPTISQDIINEFRKGFLSGKVKEETYRVEGKEDTVPSESLATYYTDIQLFYVYNDGPLNGYQSVQRRIVNGTTAIKNYFNNSKVSNILFSEYTYTNKEGNQITASRSNIETGHLYRDENTITPAVQKLNLVQQKTTQILEEISNSNITRDSFPKLKGINSFIRSINALKNITLNSLTTLEKTHARDVNLIFNASNQIKIDFLGKLFSEKNIKIVVLIPEARKSNSSKSKRERKAISKLYTTAIGSYLKKVDVTILTSSKSIKKAIEDHIVETLLEGKSSYSSTSKASYNLVIPNNKKQKVNTKVSANVSIKLPKPRATPIRNTAGQFTSIPKILNMLRSQITLRVSKNMRTPRLNYRTGRFARSVKINSVSRSDKGNWTITYSYMTYPYQTFEPGYAQGSVRRDPRSLITLSIRELVAKEIGDNFKAVRLGGIGSRGKIE